MSISIENKGLHIANNPSLYESAKSNAFDLIISADLNSNLLMEGVDESTATSDDYLSDAQEVIRIAVDESFVPHYTMGVTEIKRGNSTIKYASTPTWEAGTIKCTDFVGARVKDYLMAIRNKVYDVSKDVVNLASEYKHDWTLVEYTGDYSKVIRSWTLKGCWISQLDEDAFSHDSDGKRAISVTVQYDRAIPSKGENLL